MNFYRLVVPLAGLIFVSLPARAESPNGSCKIDWEMGRGVPKELASFFAGHRGWGMQTCTPSLGHSKYVALSPVWKGLQKVCYYSAVEVFPRKNRSGAVVWDDEPDLKGRGASFSYPFSQIYMQVPNRDCSSVARNEFVVVNGISEEGFLTIMQFWRDLISGRQVPLKTFWPVPDSKLQATNFGYFSSLISNREFREADLKSILFREAIRGYQASSRYNLKIADIRRPNNFFELQVDVVDGEVKVFNFMGTVE